MAGRNKGKIMMTRKTKGWSALAAVFAVVALGSAAPASAAESSAARLSAQWWQHAASIPMAQNPILDESGDYCSFGQRGDVWYLHGSFGNTLGSPIVRHCTIPRGQRLLVPVVNVLCTPFAGETVEDNVKLCKDFMDAVDLKMLTVDGQDRTKQIRRFGASSPFAVTMPVDSIFGYPAGTYVSVADGYYAVLPPPALGEHTIHFQGGVVAWGFTVDVVYHINVVEPGVVIFP